MATRFDFIRFQAPWKPAFNLISPLRLSRLSLLKELKRTPDCRVTLKIVLDIPDLEDTTLTRTHSFIPNCRNQQCFRFSNSA